MLILSQDRERLFNFDNIGYICLDDRTDGKCGIRIVSGTGSYLDGGYLGTYDSKERAKEVLADLCDYFNILYLDEVHNMYTKKLFKMPIA